MECPFAPCGSEDFSRAKGDMKGTFFARPLEIVQKSKMQCLEPSIRPGRGEGPVRSRRERSRRQMWSPKAVESRRKTSRVHRDPLGTRETLVSFCESQPERSKGQNAVPQAVDSARERKRER